MTAASAGDLEEIAEGKASARDMEEAGVHSPAHARSLLQRMHHAPSLHVKTTQKAIKPSRKVKRRKPVP